jgi:hypothetical protein
MRAWLALAQAANDGPALERRARVAAARALPPADGATEERSWIEPAGRVGLFFWTDEGEVERDPAWIADPGGALAIVGHLNRPWSDARTAGAPLDLGAVEEGLRARGGVYSAAAVSAAGRIAAWNTVVRAENVWYQQADALLAISSRALLAHLAAADRGDPEYDPVSLAAFVTLGYVGIDRALFRGVALLDPNHAVASDAAGTHERVRPVDVLDPSLDELAQRAIDACGPIQRAGSVNCTLTGGRDSRLVAAAMSAAGIPFRTVTKGSPTHPDVVIARMVADTLRVEHRATAAADMGSVVRVDPFERTKTALRGSDGALSGFDGSASMTGPFRWWGTTNGAGGELLRGGFVKGARPNERDDARLFVRRHWLANAHLLNRDLRDAYEAAVEPLGSAHAPETATDVLERLYARYRIARWVAPSRMATTARGRLFQPLMDDRLIHAVRETALAERVSERVVFDLLRRLNPALAEMPLTGSRWTFEKDAPVTGLEGSWTKRAPLPVPLTAGGAVDWRLSQGGPLDAVFRDSIMDAAGSNAVATLVDRDAVLRLLRRDRWAVGLTVRRAADARALWAVLAVSVLLSNEWLTNEQVERPLAIQVRPSVSDRALARLLPLARRLKAGARFASGRR